MKNFLKSLLLVVFAWTILFIPAQAAAETTTVILVRHGETFYNAQKRPQGFLDIALNENGIKQAKLLAKSLKDYPIDVFIASPLSRAYVTTEPLPNFTARRLLTPTSDSRKLITAIGRDLLPTNRRKSFRK